MKQKNSKHEYVDIWDAGTYQTGNATPPKKSNLLVAILLMLVIFLGGILSALNRSGDQMLDAEAGDFMGRTSQTVVEALKNDEMLQRYIDLYTYYVNEKMSFASVLMG